MGHIRVVFTGFGPSGFPEDRVVNVHHFVGSTGGTYSSESATARALMEEFYATPTVANAVGTYLSPWVARAATLTSYDMDIPANTRTPTIDPLTLPVAFTAGFPEEVACCLSIHGAIPPASGPRRMGRIFLGPLCAGAGDTGTSSTPARPTAAFTTDVVAACVRLRDNGEAGNVRWAIRSTRPTENYVLVAGGYVDNAWDTQRRRGPATTARTLWV